MSESKSILFVDDEPRILQALERNFYQNRDKWDIDYATSAKEALGFMSLKAYDIIFTDMRMPEMDGSTLLKEVQKSHPNTIRVVLTGHTDLEVAMRTVSFAHQFLVKPCRTDVLEEVINRALDLQLLLNNKHLLAILGQVGSLPTRPSTNAKLNKVLSSEYASMNDVLDVVEQDTSLCAKILQLVNSAFIGSFQRMTSIQSALNYLGTNMLKSLALGFEVFQTFKVQDDIPGFSLEFQQKHAFTSAHIAKALIQDPQASETAYTAAMLHGIGKLVLATYMPEQLKSALALAESKGILLYQAEKELYNVTHAEIGAYLLGIWGLPYPIIEAVAFYNNPNHVEHNIFDIMSAVYVSNILAYEQVHNTKIKGQAFNCPKIDEAYLERLGVLDRLPEWRAIAASQATIDISFIQ